MSSAAVSASVEEHTLPGSMSACTENGVSDLLAEDIDDYGSNDSDSDMDDQDEDGLECEESLMTGPVQPGQRSQPGTSGNGVQQHVSKKDKDDAKQERLEKRRKSNRESARRMRQQRIQRLARLQEELSNLKHTKQTLSSKQETLAREYENAMVEHASLKERLTQLQSKLRRVAPGTMQVDVMAYTSYPSTAPPGALSSLRVGTPKHGTSPMYNPSAMVAQQRTPQHPTNDDGTPLMFPTMKRPALGAPEGQPRPKRPAQDPLNHSQSPQDPSVGGIAPAQHMGAAHPASSPSIADSPSLQRSGIPPQAPLSAPHRLDPSNDPNAHEPRKHLNVRRQLLPPAGQVPPLLNPQGPFARSPNIDVLPGPNTPTRRAQPPMPPSMMMARAHSAPLAGSQSSPYPSFAHNSHVPQQLPLRPPQRSSPVVGMPSPGTLSSSIPPGARSPVPHARMYNRSHGPMDPTGQPSTLPPTVRLQQAPVANSPFPQSRFAAPSIVGNVNGSNRAHLPSPNPTRIPPTLSRAAARALMATQAMSEYPISGNAASSAAPNVTYSSPCLDGYPPPQPKTLHQRSASTSLLEEEYMAPKTHPAAHQRSASVGTLVDMRRLTPLPRSASPHHPPGGMDMQGTQGHNQLGGPGAFSSLGNAAQQDGSANGMTNTTGSLLNPLQPTSRMPGTLQRVALQSGHSRYPAVAQSPQTLASANREHPLMPASDGLPQYHEWQDDPRDPFPMPMPGWSNTQCTNAPLPYTSPMVPNPTPTEVLPTPIPDDLLHPSSLSEPVDPGAVLTGSKPEDAGSTVPTPLPSLTVPANNSSPLGLPPVLSTLSGLPELDMDFMGDHSFLDNLVDDVDDEAIRVLMEGVISPGLGPPVDGVDAAADSGQQNSSRGNNQNGSGNALSVCVSTPEAQAGAKLQGDEWMAGTNW